MVANLPRKFVALEPVVSSLPSWVYDYAEPTSASLRDGRVDPDAPSSGSFPTPQGLLTIDEAAYALRVSPRTVRRQIAAGALTPVRIGRLIRIAPEDLDHFIADGKSHKCDT